MVSLPIRLALTNDTSQSLWTLLQSTQVQTNGSSIVSSSNEVPLSINRTHPLGHSMHHILPSLGQLQQLDHEIHQEKQYRTSITSHIDWTADWVINFPLIHITADQHFIDAIEHLATELIKDLDINPYVSSQGSSLAQISDTWNERNHPILNKKKYNSTPNHQPLSLSQELYSSHNDDAVFPHLRLFQISNIHIKINFTPRRSSRHKTSTENWIKDTVNMILSAVGGIKDLEIDLCGQTLKGIKLYQNAFFLSSLENCSNVPVYKGIILDRSTIPALHGEHLSQLLSSQFLSLIFEHLMEGGWSGSLQPSALAATAVLHAPPVLAIRRLQMSARRFFNDLKSLHPLCSKYRHELSSYNHYDNRFQHSNITTIRESFARLVKRSSIEAL